MIWFNLDFILWVI